ncbi:helix-turn-helix domain-containing protein [Formosa sp. A9]|uniref:helix-turn-helix domain-containing protein n=1 Tax=Formosa sp. A9 TaxID=3442641 RepID=UPI003EB6C764
MKNPKLPTPHLNNTDLHFDTHMILNEDWYTNEDLMAHLNISKSTLYRLRAKNNIPAFKLGRTVIYPKNYINKFLLQGALQSLQPIKTKPL